VKIPVAILGSGFGDFKGKVTIGGKKAKVTRWGTDRIEVVVPTRLLAGEQAVVVTNRAGASTAAVSFTVTESPTGGGGAERFFRYDENTNHFNATEEDALYSTGASFNVSQNFAGFGASGKPSGLPGIILTVNGPNLAAATPFTVTILPTATGALGVTYSNYSSVYSASFDSNFTLTITGYADGVIQGTFAGVLTKLAGNGPASVTIANGSFRSTMHITGQ
jgi:hypothetical protein